LNNIGALGAGGGIEPSAASRNVERSPSDTNSVDLDLYPREREMVNHSVDRPLVRFTDDFDSENIRAFVTKLNNIERKAIPESVLPLVQEAKDIGKEDCYQVCGTCESYAKKRCQRCRTLRYCTKYCQKLHWKRIHKISCVDVTKKKVQIRVQSTLEGRGVFATEDIPAGTRVAVFDYNVKRWHLHAIVRRINPTKLEIVNADAHFKSIMRPNPDYDTSIYLHPHLEWDKSGVQLATGYILVGTTSEDNPFGVGHLIKDGAEPNFGTDKNSVTVTDVFIALDDYRPKSLSKQNVEMDDKFWFVTTKNVKKGEQLFTSHDDDFWLQRQLLKARTPEARFTYYAIINLKNSNTLPFDVWRTKQYDGLTLTVFLVNVCGFKSSEILTRGNKDPKDFMVEFLDKLMKGVAVESKTDTQKDATKPKQKEIKTEPKNGTKPKKNNKIKK